MVQSVNLSSSSSSSEEVNSSDYNNLNKGVSNANIVIDISSGDEDEIEFIDNKSECFLIIDNCNNSNNSYNDDDEDNVKGLKERIGVIRVALECVIERDFEGSYEAVCYRTKSALDSLWEVILEDCDTNAANELIELAYGALKALNKMYVCMSRNKQQQNISSFSRLLLHVRNQRPDLFRTEQMKEIEHMINSLESRSLLHSLVESGKPNRFGNDGNDYLGDTYKQNKVVNVEETSLGDSEKPNKIQSDEDIALGDSDKSYKVQNDEEITLGDSNKQNKVESVEETSLRHSDKGNENQNDEVVTLADCERENKIANDERSSGVFDKHNEIENDEEDSSGECDNKQNKIEIDEDKRLQDDRQSQIENDDKAKAPRDYRKPETIGFSGGEQLFPPLLDLYKDHDIDSLPSPTRDAPSLMPPGNPGWPALVPYQESSALKAFSSYQQKFGQKSLYMSSDFPSPTPSESGDNDEMQETCGEAETVNARCLPELVSSSSMDICMGQKVENSRFWSKSRDPRNRGIKIDIVSSSIFEVDSVRGIISGSKKQKTNDEAVLDVPTRGSIKKQKFGDEHVLDLPKLKEQKNVLTYFESSIRNIASDGIEQLRESGITNTDLLESVLKDIAVNPTVWLNLIKTEQQKMVPDPIKITHLSSSNLGDNSSVNVTRSSAQEQKIEGVLKTQPQTPSTDESETPLTIPCDPRQTLRRNSLNKVGNVVPNHTKPSSPSIPSSQKKMVSLKSCNTPEVKVPPLENKTALPVNPHVPSHQPSQDSPKTIQTQCGTIYSSVDHFFERFDEKEKAAFHKERTRRIDEQKKMFAARKLCLVLDLDHTLLNSAKFDEVDPVHEEKLKKKEEKDREKPHRHLFHIPHMGLWTKLRPGIWKFLNKASRLFELHIYTMGNKMYASAMAKLLDPKGDLFSGRVISRGDNDDDCDIANKTKDLEGVLGLESSVVIIDDTSRVWPHNRLNLIVVERYIYFPSCRKQFGLLGPSLLEIGHDERPEIGTLASCLAVIERIHQRFFAHQSLDEADVRNILASEQRKILRGCRIVFSRVFPIGENNPHLHPLWKTAEQFGAKCTNHIGTRVTHVVANSLGTEKVKWAYSTGKFVVNPGWLEASALLYRKAKEHDFAIKT